MGDDDLSGGDDDDILIGGHLVEGGSDTGDTIAGGAGEDVIAGDNAVFDDSGSSLVLTLLDVETTDASPASGSGGGDIATGGAGRGTGSDRPQTIGRG